MIINKIRRLKLYLCTAISSRAFLLLNPGDEQNIAKQSAFVSRRHVQAHIPTRTLQRDSKSDNYYIMLYALQIRIKLEILFVACRFLEADSVLKCNCV